MADRILVWFQCANPLCADIHNKYYKHKGTHVRTIPISFMSYITGRLVYEDWKTSFIPDSDDLKDIPEIVLWIDSTNESEKNSYLYPIKGIRMCQVCFNLMTKNESLEKWS